MVFQLICFNDFCLILLPDGNLTKKFIEQESGFTESQSFAASILERAIESIIGKFRKRLRLIKPPLDKLMLQVETKPNTFALRKLFAVKKGINEFQQDVDNVSKHLKDFREEIDTLMKLNLNIQCEEWEEALEVLIEDIEDIAGNVHSIIENIDETDQFVSSHQDNVRNELMKLTLTIEILALALGFGAYVGGVFGMNLSNSIEDDKNAFMIVNILLVFAMFAICSGFAMKFFTMRRDTRSAQSFSVLRNFFKCVDDLEFQDFPKLINKSDFAEAIKKILKMNVHDRELDFLFQMVDQDDDGVIDTETEWAVGKTSMNRRLRRVQKKSKKYNKVDQVV